MKNDCPCRDCIDRFAGCHGNCERYLSWQKEHIATQQKIRTAREKENAVQEYGIKTGIRIKKLRKERHN